jgi:hypothetical protein
MKHWNRAVSSLSPAYWFKKTNSKWDPVPEMGTGPVRQVLIEWHFVNGTFKKQLLLDMDDKFRIWFAPTVEYPLQKKMPKLPKVSKAKKRKGK